MYIAMNRFKVIKGREEAFEAIWKSRKTRLHEMEGYLEFHLLKGPEREDHTLYSSHTTWTTKANFVAWTESEQFRDAHKNASQRSSEPTTVGHPAFEGFEAVITEVNPQPISTQAA